MHIITNIKAKHITPNLFCLNFLKEVFLINAWMVFIMMQKRIDYYVSVMLEFT